MKIVVAEAEYGYGNCSECSYSGDVTTTVYDSIAGLLNNPQVRKDLIQAGWCPIKDLKAASDKVALENRFFIANIPTGYPYTSLREISIVDIDASVVNTIANKGMLLQQVDPQSVLSSQQYKVVSAAIQRNKNIEKGREEAAKKRSENAKKRKLEKAKKILEEAGELGFKIIPSKHEEMMGS
jgi:hypothetical protein